MAELIPTDFQAIAVGDTFGPVELVVDEPFVRRYAFSVEDDAALAVAQRRRLAVPSAMLADLLRLTNLKFDPNADFGVHQREQVWFSGLIPLGDRVQLGGTIVDKYVKRGKGYYTIEAVARSGRDGTEYVRHQATEIADIGSDEGADPPLATHQATRSGPWVEGIVNPQLEPATHADASLEVRTPVIGPTKCVTQEQMSVFSNVGKFWRSIHTDDAFARRAGFGRTVAQGMMLACYVSEVGAALFGEPWFTSGWMNVAFIAPVHASDTLKVTSSVRDVAADDEGTKVALEVWIDKIDGTRAAVGWYSASVPSSGRPEDASATLAYGPGATLGQANGG